jgi:hypothetical protein
MLCSRLSSETSDSDWLGHGRSVQYATSLKRRWDLDRGGGFGDEWGRVGCVGSGGQECGQSGPSLRQARARVGREALCRMVGSTGGHLDGLVAGRRGGRELHRRVALRRFGACCDGLWLLFVVCLQRMATEGDNGYIRVVSGRVEGLVGNGW